MGWPAKAGDVMDGQERHWNILLVEDNPADIRLTQEALKELRVQHRLEVAEDGIAALRYLTAVFEDQLGTRPDIILLDINLPRMNGLEVLAVIKATEQMKTIPVIVMSSSSAHEDVASAYRLNANCYTQKPMEMEQFIDVMKNIRSFWLETALLPEGPAGKPH